MVKLISAIERERNERLKELYLQRQKSSQNERKPYTPTRLTYEQMQEVKELMKLDYSREDAVELVLKHMK